MWPKRLEFHAQEVRQVTVHRERTFCRKSVLVACLSVVGALQYLISPVKGVDADRPRNPAKSVTVECVRRR